MTSYQRRCDVTTSHRRWYDVILILCACWVQWNIYNHNHCYETRQRAQWRSAATTQENTTVMRQGQGAQWRSEARTQENLKQDHARCGQPVPSLNQTLFLLSFQHHLIRRFCVVFCTKWKTSCVIDFHYENKPIQICWEFYHKKKKKEKIQTKILIFSYFCSKHRLWVLVRTALQSRF